MKLRLALLIAATVLTQAGATRALAFGNGGGGVGPDGKIHVGIEVRTPGVDSPVDLAGHTKTQPIIWTVVDDGPAKPGDLSGLCVPDGLDPNEIRFGWIYHFIGRALDGRLVPDKVLCVPFTNQDDPPSPPEPPQLPTIEEVWRHAHLPAPKVGLDPASRGITGLDTRIWTATRTTLTIGATLDGYAITGTATVTGYTVQVDGGSVVLAATSGDADDPIAHHVFETTGTHKVRIGVVWHGVATFSGPDLSGPVTLSIGDATISATRTYTVHEVRSVLQP